MAAYTVHVDGTQEWLLDGKLHREDDQPARVRADGTQQWWAGGKVHREGDKPAVVLADGSQHWWWDDVLHREGDLPAVIWSDGLQEWWTHGCQRRVRRVTDFRETRQRFPLVQAVVCVGLTASCVTCHAESAVGRLLEAVQEMPQCGVSSYHMTHEYAFLVALFL